MPLRHGGVRAYGIWHITRPTASLTQVQEVRDRQQRMKAGMTPQGAVAAAAAAAGEPEGGEDGAAAAQEGEKTESAKELVSTNA